MKKHIKAIVIFLLLTYNTYSQSYFSNRMNIANKVNLTSNFKFYNDTFFIPTEVIETFSPNTYSSCLLKVSKTGNIVIQKRFKPANVSYENGDLYIKNGKYYVASITSHGYDLRTGFFVFDGSCDTLFTKSYGDTNYYNYGYRIQPFKKTKDQILILGLTDSTCGLNHPGLYKPTIRVVDTNGTLIQTKIYLASNKYRTLFGCDTSAYKGYVFCGTEYQGVGGNNNDYVIKVDSNLNMTWVNYFDTTQSFCSITASKKGGYFFAGTHTDSSYATSFYWERPFLRRLDGNGNVKWKKNYGTKQLGIGTTGVKELSNGDIIICGSRQIQYSPTVGQLVGFLMRTDSSGNMKWWKNYIPTSPIKDTAGDCYLYDVIEMPDKGFAAIGWAGGDAGLGEIQQTWLLRLDSLGCLIPGCTGGTGIEEIEVETLWKLYPNPTNGQLIIEFQAPLHNTSIKITDVLGKEMKREKIESEKSELNISELDPGLYFLNIYVCDKLIITRKIIKQ